MKACRTPTANAIIFFASSFDVFSLVRAFRRPSRNLTGIASQHRFTSPDRFSSVLISRNSCSRTGFNSVKPTKREVLSFFFSKASAASRSFGERSLVGDECKFSI